MNTIEYNTLQLGALLQDIHHLAPEERFTERLSSTSTSCSEIDKNILCELLASSQQNAISIILRKAGELIDLCAQPSALDTPLTSIFNRIRLDAEPPHPLAYHQIRWSQDNADVFPCEPAKAKIQGKGLLLEWIEQFFEMFRSAKNFRALYAGALSLIDEYLWCLPIDPEHADVSLAEIVRLKSAVVACLFKQQTQVNESSEKPLFTLVVGDLSGIQGYVFEITEGGKSKEGTARRLRARSLFVQLLAEIGMQRVLAVYDLPPANILMASGGKFHVLWPDLPDNQEQLHGLQQDFDNWLLEKLHGEVSLVLAHTTVESKEMRQGFSSIIDRVENALWKAKNQKFASLLQQNSTWNEAEFIRPVDFPHDDCSSCNKFPAQAGEEKYCLHCELDRSVGRRIAEATHLACYALSVSTPLPSEFTLPVLNWKVTVLTAQDKILGTPDVILQLGGPVKPSPDYPVLWRPPAPYVVKDMDFTTIAESGEGRPLLGYLKADVDHLGKIFEWGFKEHKEGDFDIPARFSALSRQLDRFFGLWLRQYLRTTEQYQHTYTVFAGGDDVFLVGRWDTIIQLAQDIQIHFQQFTGNHPDVTLSAGIAMVKTRMPSGLAAGQAEDLLRQAKQEVSLERRTAQEEERKGRNQIAVLGDVLTWEMYAQVLKEKKTLQQDKPHSAFLYHLLQYARMWRQFKVENDTNGLRFYPLLTYNIRRNIDSCKQRNLKKWAERLVKLVLDEETMNALNHLGVISTLTLFEQRK